MGLSEREQRLLEELERGLYASEADSLSAVAPSKSRPSYRALLVGALSVVVGVVALVVALAAGLIWIAIIGFAIMLSGVLYAFSPGNRIVDSPQSAGSGPKESYSERAQRRWQERMDGER